MSRSSTPPPCASSSSTPTASPSGSAEDAAATPAAPAFDDTLDLRGEVCPYTFVRMRLRLEDLPLGARLAVLVDHEPAVRNIPRSAREWGQEIESIEPAAPAGAAVPAVPAVLWQIVVRKRVP